MASDFSVAGPDEGQAHNRQDAAFLEMISRYVAIADGDHTSPAPVAESTERNENVYIFLSKPNTYIAVRAGSDDNKVATFGGRSNDPGIRTSALRVGVKEFGIDFILDSQKHTSRHALDSSDGGRGKSFVPTGPEPFNQFKGSGAIEMRPRHDFDIVFKIEGKMIALSDAYVVLAK